MLSIWTSLQRLTLSQTSPVFFYMSPFKSFENTVGKGEIAVNSTHLENFLPFLSNLKSSSAHSLSLDESKICRLGKGLKDWCNGENPGNWHLLQYLQLFLPPKRHISIFSVLKSLTVHSNHARKVRLSSPQLSWLCLYLRLGHLIRLSPLLYHKS